MALPDVLQLPDESQFDDSPQGIAQRWKAELQVTEADRKRWVNAARKVVRRYIDDREDVRGDITRINLFWSTVQTLLAAVYARIPNPEVDRRYRDFDDDVARVAAIMLERLLNSDLNREEDDTDENLKLAIQDRFVVGLGQVWARYDHETEPFMIPAVVDPQTGQQMTQPTQSEIITWEDAPIDYVYWDDFWWSPARTWKEVRWVARRTYPTRVELVERFGQEIGQAVPLNAYGNLDSRARRGSSYGERTRSIWKQAEVFEIWDKDSKRVYWISRDYATALDIKDDPLALRGFFPCPKPLIATSSTTRFMPRSDYSMVQDQYEQLDLIETRLQRLTLAVKAVGVYDKANVGLERIMTEGKDNCLVPVENFGSYAEKGGMKGSIDWLPIQQYVDAIVQMTTRKQAIISDIWQLLGVSDIMRGSSSPDETLGAQELKLQFGGARTGNLQSEVALFVRNAMQLRADIVIEHFQDDTIMTRSNIVATDDKIYANAALASLRDPRTLFRLIVDADSLAAPDWQRERQERVDFMQMLSQYIQGTMPLLQSQPSTAPYLLRFVQWAAAGFRVSRSVETMIDQAIRAAEQQAQQMQQQPPQPTPVQQEQLAKAGKAQADTAKSTAETQRTQTETQYMQEHLGLQKAQIAHGAPPHGLEPPTSPTAGLPMGPAFVQPGGPGLPGRPSTQLAPGPPMPSMPGIPGGSPPIKPPGMP